MTGLPDVVRLTQDLVRIQSANPTVPEAQCAEYVEDVLRQHDVTTERVPVSPGRWNVMARLKGSGGPPFLLLAHMDTVPVGDGWTREAWSGDVSEGRLWGRGSCDMKGGLAASLIAFLRIRDAGRRLSGDLVFICTVDEESSMTGAYALNDAGLVPSNSYILAAEPSNGQLLVAQKGLIWHELRFRGVSAHGSMPHLGADANRALAIALEGAYQGIASLGGDDPLLGRATLVAGVIQGGFKTNVVSDQSRAEIDVRFPPSTTAKDVEQMIVAAAEAAERALPGVQFAVQRIGIERPPVVCDPASPLIAAVEQAHKEVTGLAPARAGFRAYTDAAMCAVRSGSRHSVVYGPGQLAQAHTVDEFVAVDDLKVFEDTLAQTARLLLGE